MEKYKANITIPTGDFANIKVDVEGTPEEIVNANREFTELIKPKEGITQKEFNVALDRYLTDGDGEAEVYENMSQFQKDVFQEIKKSFKRINK